MCNIAGRSVVVNQACRESRRKCLELNGGGMDNGGGFPCARPVVVRVDEARCVPLDYSACFTQLRGLRAVNDARDSGDRYRLYTCDVRVNRRQCQVAALYMGGFRRWANCRPAMGLVLAWRADRASGLPEVAVRQGDEAAATCQLPSTAICQSRLAG